MYLFLYYFNPSIYWVYENFIFLLYLKFLLIFYFRGGIFGPQLGDSHFLHWNQGVLNTGTPGKSLIIYFKYSSTYINPWLLIYFSPSPFPFGNHKFSMSVSLFLFCKFICVIFWISHISATIWYLSFCFWFTSFSVTISRTIHVAANGII